MVRKQNSQAIVSALVNGDKRLELVRPRTDSTALLCWNGQEVSVSKSFKVGTQTYVAANLHSDIPPDIRLASTMRDYRSAEALVNEIGDILRSFTGASHADAELAAFFAIATHFPECRDPALRGILSAADEWDASRFLKLLACFCRHAVPLANFDVAQLLRRVPGCAPTFLISDPKPSRRLVAMLNGTQHHGFAVTRVGKMASPPFSAVILDCDGGLSGIAPSSFCRIDATPRTRAEPLSDDELGKIEDEFQSQLLSYRLCNWSQVKRATFDACGLCGSTRALAAVLGSCFPNNQNLQVRAQELLKPQDEDRRFDSACGERAVVLDALLVLCHRNENEIHVGEVAKFANEILRARGDGYQLNPRRVGAILKPFRLSHSRDCKGYKFLLSVDNKRKVHELGRAHDVPFFKGKIQQCDFCRESAEHSPGAIAVPGTE